MDGCSLNDAFPNGAFGAAGCTDRGAAEESRRQEKKKARKCRGPQLSYLNGGMNMVGSTSPDLPHANPIGPDSNPESGISRHEPVTQQYNYETFVGSGGMDSLPMIRNDVKGPTSLQESTAPSFFGSGAEDDAGAALRVHGKNGLTESFQNGAAPFVNVIGSNDHYKLEPDFTKSFAQRGAQKAANVGSGPTPGDDETAYLTPTGMLPNSILPVPNVDVFWKENGLAGGQSAFFSNLKAPGGLPVGSAADQDAGQDVPTGRREVLTKLDRIFARLDDMDSQKSENAQTEVLLFIMTGLGVIFLMDIGCRTAASIVRR
jgi:hypothetical protein